MGIGLGIRLLGLLLLIAGCGQHSPLDLKKASAQSFQTLVNGKLVTREEASQYSGVVSLSFVGDESKGGCTASYLGNGRFLSAYHCLLDNKSDSSVLRIRRYDLGSNGSLDLRQFNYSTPLTESIKIRKLKKDLPLPDLMLIDGGEPALNYMNGTKPVELPAANSTPTENLQIIGYGKDGYRGVTVSGLLRVGSVRLSETDDLYHTLSWFRGDDLASAASGDSGGPLFQMRDNGTLVAYGVAHAVKLHKNAGEKDFSSAITFYTRLDRQTILDWIAAPALQPSPSGF